MLSIVDSFSTIWEKRMGNFMGNRKPQTTARFAGTEFDPKSSRTYWDCTRIKHIITGHDRDSH